MNVSKDVSALPKSDLRQQNIGAVQNQFCGTQMLCSVFKCRSSTLINVMFLKIVPSNINEICTGPVNPHGPLAKWPLHGFIRYM